MDKLCLSLSVAVAVAAEEWKMKKRFEAKCVAEGVHTSFTLPGFAYGAPLQLLHSSFALPHTDQSEDKKKGLPFPLGLGGTGYYFGYFMGTNHF